MPNNALHYLGFFLVIIPDRMNLGAHLVLALVIGDLMQKRGEFVDRQARSAGQGPLLAVARVPMFAADESQIV